MDESLLAPGSLGLWSQVERSLASEAATRVRDSSKSFLENVTANLGVTCLADADA